MEVVQGEDFVDLHVANRGSAPERSDGELGDEPDGSRILGCLNEGLEDLNKRSAILFEVARGNECFPGLCRELVRYAWHHLAQVAFGAKIHHADERAMPEVEVVIACKSPTGILLQGPVKIGAFSSCTRLGVGGYQLNVTAEALLAGTDHSGSNHAVMTLDLFHIRRAVMKAKDLALNRFHPMPHSREDLSQQNIAQVRQEFGLEEAAPVGAMAWFS